MLAGNCVEHETPDIFFPNRDTDAKVTTAKAVCAECDVVEECLEFALSSRSLGIWGGTTLSERTAIRKQRKASA